MYRGDWSLEGPVGRLRVFEVVLEADSRPGFLYERGRLVTANASARRLLSSHSGRAELLETLRGALFSGPGRTAPVICLGGEDYALRVAVIAECLEVPVLLCFLERPVRSLTVREAEVLKWLTLGATNAEIALGLGISVETVKKHVSHVLGKARARTRTALAARIREFG